MQDKTPLQRQSILKRFFALFSLLFFIIATVAAVIFYPAAAQSYDFSSLTTAILSLLPTLIILAVIGMIFGMFSKFRSRS
jgi:uncharacterized BrkB/YihY/UPF0761 family membrane protein